MSARQGTVVNVDWDVEIDEVGPVQCTEAESNRGFMGAQACGYCGTRINNFTESEGSDVVLWCEVEADYIEDHTEERCQAQRAARDEAHERIVGFMHDLTYRERAAWADQPESMEKVRAIARIEAEEGVLGEVFEPTVRTEPVPGQTEDFRAGVRWALHMLAYGRRYDGGWWEDSWAPGYGADVSPDLRLVDEEG